MFYNMLRLLLFAVVFTVLYLAGARTLLLFGLAFLVSGVLSYFLLAPQRAAMAGELSSRVRGFRHRLDAGSRAEDRD
jgi:outer membrane murein-binding lipoprotein Lpp